MNQKRLSNIIKVFAYKRLAAVECQNSNSNQHEFNGMAKLKEILGKERLKDFPVKIIYLDDNEAKILNENSSLSWYDSRENDPNRSAEFRLYYKHNEPMALAEKNDLFVFFPIANNNIKKYYLIIAPQGSSSDKQLCWLFDIQMNLFDHKLVSQNTNGKYINSFIHRLLEICDIDIDITDENYLDGLIKRFNDSFPSTMAFSKYAQSLVKNADPIKEPDKTLVNIFEMENILFKTFEKYIVSKELKSIDLENIDSFISYSLSVQNRRKSRAGRGFENHIKYILEKNGLDFSYNKISENDKRPDFLFPNIQLYHNHNFDSNKLFMLAAKTTCKDRWRQVLSEADRIEKKHLITMEPAISEKQTEQMKAKNLQLVIPKDIQPTYNSNQKK